MHRRPSPFVAHELHHAIVAAVVDELPRIPFLVRALLGLPPSHFHGLAIAHRRVDLRTQVVVGGITDH